MPFLGNFQTITRYDDAVQEIRLQQRLGDVEFELYTKTGEKRRFRGTYYLCDGGYHRWRVLITGFKHPIDLDEARFSKWLESMRKDVGTSF